MRLTKVEAPTMGEALRRIRARLGEDALIVGTRSVRRGGVLGIGGRDYVEVYVTDTRGRRKRLEQALAARRRAAVAAPAAPAGAGPARIEEIAAALAELRGEVRKLFLRGEDTFPHPAMAAGYRFLCDREVDPDLARSLVAGMDPSVLPDEGVDADLVRALLLPRIARFLEEAADHDGAPARGMPRAGEGSAREADAALRRRLTAAAAGDATDAPAAARGRIVAFVGPTGVGKTTTIAKLAARERVAKGRRVGVVTLDTFRIAAVDQLRKYAEIMEIPLEVAADPAGFRTAVGRLAACERIYVDSAGRSPRDEVRIGELEAFLRAVPRAEVVLVLATTARPRAIRGAIGRFRRLGFRRLVLTKVDEADGLGGILEIVRTAGCPVAYVTDGQNVPDDIARVDPRGLARIVLGEDA